jgi:uncharacterized delta-60 repeat protein
MFAFCRLLPASVDRRAFAGGPRGLLLERPRSSIGGEGGWEAEGLFRWGQEGGSSRQLWATRHRHARQRSSFMIKQFTPRPRFRSVFFSLLPSLAPTPRSPSRSGRAGVFAILLGLGQAAQAQAVGGDPDLSFDGDGRVITDLSDAGRADTANDLAIQFDDKIVVVGMRPGDNARADVAVLRFNPDGTPDASFGQQGVRIEPFLVGQDDAAEGVVLQRDGKIVVVGSAGNPPNLPPALAGTRDFLVARFNLDGTLDPTFGGGDGFVTTGFGPGSDDFATAVVLQADGRIVAAGDSNANGPLDFALVR